MIFPTTPFLSVLCFLCVCMCVRVFVLSNTYETNVLCNVSFL